MSYLVFHFIFIVPAIVVLAVLARPDRRDLLIIGGMALIALIYTTPWDNYLVYRGVWSYGADRVLGTIGYVPVEEYLFFILQPVMTGLAYILVDRHSRSRGGDTKRPRIVGACAGLVIAGVGALALKSDPTFYLGLILVWSGPVIAGQWCLRGDAFLTRACLFGIFLPTIYLWIADRVAIASGIWSISDEYTIGFEPLGLPIEEAVFFLMTNVLVVQGIILFRRGLD